MPNRVALVDESVVPTPLRAVIERGSAFEPSARFQTIRDFACAVRESAKGAFSHGASQAREPSCEAADTFGAVGDEGDNCCGSAASSGIRSSC